jgi:hypothetical protein
LFGVVIFAVAWIWIWIRLWSESALGPHLSTHKRYVWLLIIENVADQLHTCFSLSFRPTAKDHKSSKMFDI